MRSNGDAGIGLGRNMNRNIDSYFLGTGIVLAIAGMILGIGMGVSENFLLAPVHTHINLVGWVSLALFGLAYRSELAVRGRLAVAHYWIAATGAVLFPIGIYVTDTQHQPGLAILGSLLTLASMLLFLVNWFRQTKRTV